MPEVRDRIVRILRRLGDVEREREVPLELGLDEGLVVREDEAAALAALGELGRPRERSALRMREVGRLAVRDVEDVGREPRMEVLDRRVVQVPGQREVDRVVRRRRAGLPPLRIEEPLSGRVPVDVEGEVEAVVEAHDRLRLRLGGLGGPAVRVARRDARGALLVVLEVLRVVAVRVDAVADLGRSVRVVVAQVLPPEAGVLARERVLVAVRVGDDDEPELVLPQELPDLLVAVPPAVRRSTSAAGC